MGRNAIRRRSGRPTFLLKEDMVFLPARFCASEDSKMAVY
jgi:hypothetical protein